MGSGHRLVCLELAKAPPWQVANILLVWCVRVISRRVLFERVARYADAKSAVETWYFTAKASEWRNLADIREAYPSADMVGNLAIFNIRGNNYRLIVRVAFETGRIYIKEFLTHAEYDKGRWKKWL